ncbi:Asp-tRNA(Asn)/Glu-tRNA(Gln) amidotransferase subunit GatC [Campylobacter sp. LH-2024]|uniref:Asp-tRNA(Asn)/Glu-tRNA(Gln) amidotransferase subunit GatC n=1 Tax=Campylobacter molothri TaxID=1032242 RepID=A0ACC5W1K3_9BACT|nr:MULTISPECIES: Asp-tRNA(Asn)/Glu-tRNA(Gln) amidotransferase subunit GatC [unclassified Campylobacter]MBZ7927806.1 Asp-tRNA(Asn)/Glu-tRNA(Gln) amidotransferase subunit GatC [Campylobacter sp. RM10542]MBZ7929758.1 Asp-tRNA(Asn)/Glu-tRNA(Gln) amidotransferase subunit GatC [Campylobacter sp. W0067]MBZ7931144.1 Asp-tRNA(Asn)/Glu-tRNA(Gln) amidotransferase subunit GatC [Campylobacter sp. RM12910]MBZ7932746.1 Asp-tRNA(Asn)/Glu-tRNA(Gln) amidotransferase subunit GatC [Campylobacter sp. RM10543]MBZ79
MQINEELLTKLEKLSALKIAEDKRDKLVQELEEIVNFVEKLNELDLSSSEVTVSTIKGGTPLRLDQIENNDIIKDVLNHSPKKDENFFVVPKIIE